MISFAERTFSRFKQQFSVPLYANAYALIFNQIASAGLGVLYWALAARLYSVEMVGQNTAIISAVMFLSALSEFSLKSAMTRFVPRAGRGIKRLLVSTYSINIVLSVLVTIVFFVLGQDFNFTFALLKDTKILPILLLLMPSLWTVFYVQDGVLIGFRETKWVLYENTLYNILKIVLLVGFFMFTSNRYGIVASWFLPTPVLIALVNGMIFFRFVPQHLAQENTQVPTITPIQIARSVTGDHVGTILAETCVRLLPLMVLNLLGKNANAYFYQAWLIGNTIYLVAYNLASSFSVEASSNLNQIATYSRRILIQKARLVVPLALGVLAFAPFVLRIFGEDYAEQGTSLLRWLSLAAFPMIINIWYLGYVRVTGKIGAIIRNQFLISSITLFLSFTWIPKYGITFIGIAWFLSQTLVAVIVLIETAPLLLSRQVHVGGEEEASLNVRVRRADWRFLSSIVSPRKSISLSNGLLAKAISAITIEEMVTPEKAADESVDLVAIRNPKSAALRFAYSKLSAAGVLYSEWTPWRVGGAWGIRRKLRSAGFTTIKLFWVYPSIDAPHLWLPIDANRSLYEYLALQFLSGESSFREFTRKILVRILVLFMPLGFVPFLSVIAYKDGDSVGDVMDLVRKEWSRNEEKISAGQLSYLMQTGGVQLFSKIIYLVFSPDSSTPRWVVKLPRMPTDAQTLRHEENILGALQGDDFQRYKDIFLPRIVFSRDWNGVWISAQTALSGTSLNKLIKEYSISDLASRMTDWQIALAKLSRDRDVQPPSGQVVDRLFNKLVMINFPQLHTEDLKDIRNIFGSLNSFPLVCAHNDFAPWNVMRSAQGLGVFDWTDADWNSLPLMDLVYGLSNLAFLYEDAWDEPHKVKVYRSLLDSETEFGKMFNHNLHRYADEIGIPPGLIAPLRLATWIIHCHFEYINRKVEQDDLRAQGEIQESVCLPLLQAELNWQTRADRHGR